MIDYGIELRVKEPSTQKFAKAILVAVKGIPATGQAGGTADITTSSDASKVYVPSRKDTGELDYTYNYKEADFTAVKALCDGEMRDILIKLPDGAGFMYSGVLETWTNDVSVDGIIEATLHTVSSSDITFKTSTEVTALINAN